jgi:hypothetical protein
MSPSEIVAYIGAAAWLPQIGVWIVKWLTKPKLNLKLAPTILLTHSPHGTSIALITALSAERRDAFITEIKLRVTHERGEERILCWETLSETVMGIRGLPETLSFENSQPALALKVSTMAVTQKTIWFLGSASKSKSLEVIARLQEHVEFLKAHSQDPASELLRSKEFSQAKDLLAEDLFWKEGEYTCELEIYESNRKAPHRESFKFLLTKADATELRDNVSSIEPYLRQATLSDGSTFAWTRRIVPIRPA